MVFFNYSTMQMAAKVVYYGPGLCGKTTNLHHIYQQTAADSRGEMVSLETETDRTLFFDLLPIDVGNVGGFKTRVQLYTVPGQVFYNTTRKLVLKGVDGVVFVADSQRPMLDANVESIKNLEENLAESSLDFETIPIVLQFNKRDLKDICSVDEMNRALNLRGWPFFEASALRGDGVFETLRGISRLTLASVRKRLAEGSAAPATPTRTSGSVAAAAPAATRPIAAVRPLAPLPPIAPAVAMPVEPTPQPAPRITPPPPPIAPAPSPAPMAPVAVSGGIGAPREGTFPGTSPTTPASSPRRSTSQINVVQEIENLRKSTLRPSGAVTTDGIREIHRSLQLNLRRDEWARARKMVLNLEVTDGDQQALQSLRDLTFDIERSGDTTKLVLRLSVVLTPRD